MTAPVCGQCGSARVVAAYARRLKCDGFYATAAATDERAQEEQLARERGLQLRELKPIEGASLATGNTTWSCLQCGALFQVRARSVEREPEGFEPELAVLLALAMEVVRNGGKLTLVGSGPLRPDTYPFDQNVETRAVTTRRRYEGTLTSHSGARGASGTGETLAEMLAVLMRQWGNL